MHTKEKPKQSDPFDCPEHNDNSKFVIRQTALTIIVTFSSKVLCTTMYRILYSPSVTQIHAVL